MSAVEILDGNAPEQIKDVMLPGVDRIPLIPIRSRQYGPLVLKRRWRTFGVWLLVFAASWFLLSRGYSTGWNAFALSVMFPGAGFFYSGTVVGSILAVLAVISVPAAMINWFACGNISNVVVTWLGGAALAAAYAAYWGSPVTAVANWTPFASMAFVAGWAVIDRVGFVRGRNRARGHNEVISRISEPLLHEIPTRSDTPEMNALELAVARSFYQKALQPPGQWDGFALDVEQWQLRATRYQLYSSIATLASVSFQHTPSFHGYARDAIANLIYKNLDKRIWQFWFWENLWGNFDLNPDPIRKDNIMVTGWIADYLGMYETLFQDRRFDEKGALNWRWSDSRQFKYNHTDLVEALMHNYGRYDFSWYPCEPNLLYSMCNIEGFNALQFYDRLRGTDNWSRIHDRVEKSFEEEFMHPDGRVVCLLFNRLGLQAPMLSSVLGEGSSLPGMLAMWPDKAERLWHVMKRQFLYRNPNGATEVKMLDFSWDRWDATAWAGNVTTIRRAHELRPMFALLKAAVHIGDDEVVRVLSDLVDKKFGEGTSGAIKLGQRKAGLYRFINEGLPKAITEGPILEEATFPDVLVARAVSDGQDLSLVLRPGSGDKLTRLGLARLRPGVSYRVTGSVDDNIVADVQGKANFLLRLNERKELRIAPVS